MTESFWTIVIFFLGLIFGSFLNALEYRINKKISLKGRSFCPKCKKKISWYANIPLLSFIILLGRCRHCHKPISIQYPLIELTSGLLFLLAWKISKASTPHNQRAGSFLNLDFQILSTPPLKELIGFILLASCFFLLLLIALHDLKTKYVLTYYTYGAAILALAYQSLNYGNTWELANLSNYFYPLALSALIPATIFWLISKLSGGKAMGSGDADIAIAIGILLGWPLVAVSYYFAFLTGAIVGIVLIVLKKAGLKSEIPLGPFLVSGV